MAFAGIMAGDNTTSDHWYFNNCIDISCKRNLLEGSSSPELDVPNTSLWDMAFIEKKYINNSSVRGCAGRVISNLLEEGYYVIFDHVDDYYVEGKSWYKQRHFSHDGLIHGYNKNKNCYNIAAYDARWLFCSFETPKDKLLRALYQPFNTRLGDLTGGKSLPQTIALDTELILIRLKDYLGSCSSRVDQLVHGFAVHDHLIMYLEAVKDGRIRSNYIDTRIIRLLWEHKQCMHDRIAAVERLLSIGNKISPLYQQVTAAAAHARFLMSKYALKKNEALLTAMQKDIETIKALEERLLYQFCIELEGKGAAK